ncbi:MAG: tRNA pseudouridine(13) synthase TruD [Anaerolineae bacterium]
MQVPTPYLTADLPGIGGRIKAHPEDFVVEEIPLYQPCGEGQHVYATIEKRGLSTFAAIRNIARALNISTSDIGSAGLKDAHAITRQTLSINLVSPEAVAALELPNINILQVTRHKNKLKTGHLAGNRFEIRVRDVTPDVLPAAEAVLQRLSEKGVPNYFGEQRFGVRHNTDQIGEALLRNDPERFVAEYLGEPRPYEAPHIQAARRLVDERRWEEALAQWPPELADERNAVAAVIRANGDLSAARRGINKRLLGLFVSAFQSKLFNLLLTERLHTFDQLEAGDIAYIHGKGAAFLVEEPAAEQPRADNFEISPAGPMFGPKMLQAAGEPARREEAVLAQHRLTVQDFSVAGLKIRGTRRPYRFPLKSPKIWWDEGVMVSFELPAGAYATTVLGEIMKGE